MNVKHAIPSFQYLQILRSNQDLQSDRNLLEAPRSRINQQTASEGILKSRRSVYLMLKSDEGTGQNSSLYTPSQSLNPKPNPFSPFSRSVLSTREKRVALCAAASPRVLCTVAAIRLRVHSLRGMSFRGTLYYILYGFHKGINLDIVHTRCSLAWLSTHITKKCYPKIFPRKDYTILHGAGLALPGQVFCTLLRALNVRA